MDILEKEAHAAKYDQETSPPSEKISNGPNNGPANGAQKEPLVTWVHKNFQVTLLSQILERCFWKLGVSIICELCTGPIN